MSRAEMKSAVGRDMKTSQLEKATSLAALRPEGGLPPCARWWEGNSPRICTPHTDTLNTLMHTNDTHARHRVVRPTPGLHPYARHQGGVSGKRHHVRLGPRILGLALPIPYTADTCPHTSHVDK